MIIDCISDLHGHYPDLKGGDLLIVAGDLTARDTLDQHAEFNDWLHKQNYRKKIVIAGNHDNHFIEVPSSPFVFSSYSLKDGQQISYAHYLCDSGTEFTYWADREDGSKYIKILKIWGSPWTKTFPGMNPKCKAFTCDTEEELAEKWALIPEDTDILITHGPPRGILDWNSEGKQCGSESLLKKSTSLKNLKLFVFGHIHEAYSHIDVKMVERVSNSIPCEGYSMPIIVNCSHVNEYYKPVNKPIRVIL